MDYPMAGEGIVRPIQSWTQTLIVRSIPNYDLYNRSTTYSLHPVKEDKFKPLDAPPLVVWPIPFRAVYDCQNATALFPLAPTGGKGLETL
jgi:hypothetical protein